jgi:hypothetical protein
MVFAKWSARRGVVALALAAGLAVPAAMAASPASASALSAAHTASPGAVQSVRPSFTYAVNAWWSPSVYGNTLKIDPSGFARAVGISAAQGVMNNALSIAGWPPYSQSVYNSMFEQLQCHMSLAPYKSTYDLDTWRPSVSWVTEIHDDCNPGYPGGTL